MKWLKGKRTIIGSLLGGVVVVCWSMEIIDLQAAGVALGFIGSLTGVFMRVGVKNDIRAAIGKAEKGS